MVSSAAGSALVIPGAPSQPPPPRTTSGSTRSSAHPGLLWTVSDCFFAGLATSGWPGFPVRRYNRHHLTPVRAEIHSCTIRNLLIGKLRRWKGEASLLSHRNLGVTRQSSTEVVVSDPAHCGHGLPFRQALGEQGCQSHAELQLLRAAVVLTD